MHSDDKFAFVTTLQYLHEYSDQNKHTKFLVSKYWEKQMDVDMFRTKLMFYFLLQALAICRKIL